MKIKALRPSLREKKRYIAYEMNCDCHRELINKIETMLGVINSGAAGIQLVMYNAKKGILRVNHTAVDQVRACFVMLAELKKQPVTIKTLLVTGMLHKAKAEI